MTDDEARALDRQVALALGYTEDVFDWAYGGDSDHIVKASCWSLPDGRHTYQGSLPHFSTDLATAWTVLEHMGHVFQCDVEVGTHRSQVAYYGGMWFARIHGGSLIYPSFNCAITRFATTAPEAICRATLAVLEAQP